MKKLFIILGLSIGLFFAGANLGYCEGVMQDKNLTISKIGVLVDKKQYETALEQCNEALKIYPEEYFLYYWRAAIYSALGNKKSALTDYNKAITLKPQNANLYVMRGICKYGLKDEKGALNDYNKAIELDKNNGSAYSMRAIIKLENGDFDGADKDLIIADQLMNKQSKNDDTKTEKKEEN